MTDDEARRLATRIIDTWPNAARAYIWRDILAPLDLITARQAYWTLERETLKGAPTPGQFHAAYHAADRANNPPDTTHPTLDDNEPGISLEHYLDQLRARASHGDSDATAELHAWRRARHTIEGR